MDAIPKSSLGGLRYIPPQVVQVKSVGNGGIPVKLCGPLKQPPGRREVRSAAVQDPCQAVGQPQAGKHAGPLGAGCGRWSRLCDFPESKWLAGGSHTRVAVSTV